MSKEIKLPSGATAVIRDPKTLKHKDRVAVMTGMTADASDPASAMQLQARFIAVLVESWTLELLPPSVKPESIGELEIADYDRLAEEVNDAMPILFPQLAKTVEAEADPKVITENSND